MTPSSRTTCVPLDFGHWAAHKLEMLTDHALRHGEAMAIGIALDSAYSVQAGELDERHHQLIVDLLQRLHLPTWHEWLRDPALVDGLAVFREHLGGELCLTMLRGLGAPIEVDSVDEKLLRRAIGRLDTAPTMPRAA